MYVGVRERGHESGLQCEAPGWSAPPTSLGCIRLQALGITCSKTQESGMGGQNAAEVHGDRHQQIAARGRDSRSAVALVAGSASTVQCFGCWHAEAALEQFCGKSAQAARLAYELHLQAHNSSAQVVSPSAEGARSIGSARPSKLVGAGWWLDLISSRIIPKCVY